MRGKLQPDVLTVSTTFQTSQSRAISSQRPKCANSRPAGTNTLDNVGNAGVNVLFSVEMAMWDPEAAGNAAIYLRLPELDMIDIRSAPFSAKTAVWVPDKEIGYIKGEKLGEKDGKIEVKRADDKTKKYKPEGKF